MPSPTLQELRARLRALERPGTQARATLSLGAAEIDAALPWGGLPLGRLHQITGGEDGFGGPPIAFTARLAARLAGQPPDDGREPGREPERERGLVLWVVAAGTPDDTLYGPGLAAWGLTPDRLVVARATTEADVLWCLEEGLRCPALSAVVGHGRAVGLTAGRRLQLAAEEGGTTGFLLPSDRAAGWRTAAAAEAATAATTRWHVVASPAAPAPWNPRGLGAPRWTVSLERCQGGLPRSWLVECDDASGHLTVVSELGDRPADTAGSRPCRSA
jgi:protein ImuA